jgi:hypothetical protein
MGDVSALRALAHPLRWSLIEVLIASGTATATECAKVLGEPVNSCSFHLRMLEKYGYVERAPTASGKERPWRVKERQVSWDWSDPDQALAADELDEMLIDKEATRQRNFVRTRATLSASLREAVFARGAYRWLTPDELAVIGDEMAALLARFDDRTGASAPEGATLVRLVGIGIPAAPGQ